MIGWKRGLSATIATKEITIVKIAQNRKEMRGKRILIFRDNLEM